ncbi:MAG TPA: HAMP domain-containing sensor histidine kinase [Micromonosporaceae bacterium]|nr:HAMP domain-containing sensor histidine kinase [Micromonosporaceae bacterium]
MTGAWRSLRVRLAVLGFLASYGPALVLFGIVRAVDVEVTAQPAGQQLSSVDTQPAAAVTWTPLALVPVAAGLAWWLAGRAVYPIERLRAVAADIAATGDLSRRTGLGGGPTELAALAAGFDAMLDRLELAAQAQRRLVEETSHELRVPLAVLAANADVLLAHPAPTLAVYREGLERSRRAATRLRTTVDELLVDARGRARTIDRRPVDLAALARGVVDDARLLAQRRGIDLTLTAPLAVVRPVDGPAVRRAVANVVDNALRYAPAGSAVEVEVETDGAQAVVVVTDHGPGIAPDQQEQVFSRFWRGRDDPHGTGLGLPIARQVALAHGGELTLDSPGPAGDGCVFRLHLR